MQRHPRDCRPNGHCTYGFPTFSINDLKVCHLHHYRYRPSFRIHLSPFHTGLFCKQLWHDRSRKFGSAMNVITKWPFPRTEIQNANTQSNRERISVALAEACSFVYICILKSPRPAKIEKESILTSEYQPSLNICQLNLTSSLRL